MGGEKRVEESVSDGAPHQVRAYPVRATRIATNERVHVRFECKRYGARGLREVRVRLTSGRVPRSVEGRRGGSCGSTSAGKRAKCGTRERGGDRVSSDETFETSNPFELHGVVS